MTGDTLDLFSDVYVGRIPCNNAAQIAAFVNKDTIYELHPDTTYLKKAFLPWEWIEPNIGYGGFLCNDNIKEILSSDWQVSVVGNATPTMTIDSINAGKHFMHFAGHGNYDVFGSAFSTPNVASLTNTASHKLTIINSMASFCGEFDDQECLGETLMNSATGGAVAAMLNARYGWGAPPNMGPGEHFSQEFYRRYQFCREIGVASGGPGLLPQRRAQPDDLSLDHVRPHVLYGPGNAHVDAHARSADRHCAGFDSGRAPDGSGRG